MDAEGFGYYVVETADGCSVFHPQNSNQGRIWLLEECGDAY